MADKDHFLNSVSLKVFVGVVGLSIVIGTVGGLLIGSSRQAATSGVSPAGTPGVELSCSTRAVTRQNQDPEEGGEQGSGGGQQGTTLDSYSIGETVFVGLDTLKAHVTYPDPSWYNPFNTTTKVVNVPFQYAPTFWTANGGSPSTAPASGTAEDAIGLATFSTTYSAAGEKTISIQVRFSSDDVQNYLEEIIEDAIGFSLPSSFFSMSLSDDCSYRLSVVAPVAPQSPLDTRKKAVENAR